VNPGKDSDEHRGMITRTAESVFGALLYLREIRRRAADHGPKSAAGHH
jgi:hypothetical protein